jgi:hypothetical protein
MGSITMVLDVILKKFTNWYDFTIVSDAFL